jgi:hypothetical protein
MFVLSTGANREKTRVFLNSERDFRSERNLTVVLDLKALEKEFAEAKIADPRKHYDGKKVEVRGKVTLFKDSPQIEVTRLSQIKVLE